MTIPDFFVCHTVPGKPARAILINSAYDERHEDVGVEWDPIMEAWYDGQQMIDPELNEAITYRARSLGAI